VPTATILFIAIAPFTFDVSAFNLEGALWFLLVGLFFPGIVTLLTFRSNEALGPTVTGAVSGTAPLFAILAAALLLNERVPPEAMLAAFGIVIGVGLISWKTNSSGRRVYSWSLLWPVAGAVVRGCAQAGAKAGLLLWPNPFAASLIGYCVSSATVLGLKSFTRSASRKPTRHGVMWFVITGVLNGSAVLLMYAALNHASVALVAPIVATYPLVTALASALVLREESMTRRMIAGALVTVLAIAYLVSANARSSG
jgi:drug/metabolite transporter (DMT)-like permease